MHNYKNLKVWKDSIMLSTEIYSQTRSFPRQELFGLGAQMQRCSVSIASNIAEGTGRNSNKELSRFLSVAIGSAFELETQLIICKNLGYMNEIVFENIRTQIADIQRMLYSLIQNLKG